MAAALRGIADRYYGRATLVISHPVILLAFRARLTQTVLQRDDVDALPPLAHAVVDYLEGRFYLVQDFPVRRIPSMSRPGTGEGSWMPTAGPS